jgi:hypothetical protein
MRGLDGLTRPQRETSETSPPVAAKPEGGGHRNGSQPLRAGRGRGPRHPSNMMDESENGS